jgi:hypothetical protein
MFYNIQNNNAPMCLCDLIPPSIQSTTVYSLRNGRDIIMPFCRLSNTYDSFDWHHNDKTDMRLYLLGTNRNSKKKQNIEAGLK